MSYVVIVKPPDDHPGFTQTYGPFTSKVKADAFAAAITKAVEDAEAETDGLDETGWAYVKRLHSGQDPVALAEARLYALRGER